MDLLGENTHPLFPLSDMAVANGGPLRKSALSSSHTSSARGENESTPDLASAMDGGLHIQGETDGDLDSLMDDASDTVDDYELPPHGLPTTTLPTGLCYDERMRYHAEVAPIGDSNFHPEDPRRILNIYRELCQAGLVDDPQSKGPLVRQPMLRIPVREATEAECCLIHTSKHYEFIKATAGMHIDKLSRSCS